MEIVFLGTGGGRINLIKQIRGTGGFRIDSSSANIHVDPGPGALLSSLGYKEEPLDLDAVIVTHNHVDHFSDAMVIIEGMTNYGLKKRGIVIGSKAAMEGQDRAVHGYHQSKVDFAYAAVPGEKKTFNTEKGSFEIEIIAMKHEEGTAFGFKLSMDGKVVGHITDTEPAEHLGKAFSGCDALIVNCMKPEADKYHGHLTTNDVIAVLKEARPATCVITHMGLKMMKAGPAKEAEKIEKESGVKTVAAKDGLRFKV